MRAYLDDRGFDYEHPWVPEPDGKQPDFGVRARDSTEVGLVIEVTRQALGVPEGGGFATSSNVRAMGAWQKIRAAVGDSRKLKQAQLARDHGLPFVLMDPEGYWRPAGQDQHDEDAERDPDFRLNGKRPDARGRPSRRQQRLGLPARR